MEALDGLVAATKRNTESSYSCFTYDDRGRLLTKTVPAFGGEPARTITNNYKAVDPDGAGPKPVSSEWAKTSDNSTSSIVANPAILTKTDWLGRGLQYTDALGRLTTTSYDIAGRATQVVGPAGYGTIVDSYGTDGRLAYTNLDGARLNTPSYNAGGGLHQQRYQPGLYSGANAFYSVFDYDERGRPHGVSNWKWTDSLGTYAGTANYVWRSNAGRVTSAKSDHSTGPAYLVDWLNPAGNDYFYDGAGRLSEGWSPGARRYQYSFADATSADCPAPAALNAGKNSNRSSVTETVSSVTTARKFCYDAADRLVSTTTPGGYGTFTYDTRGNTTRVGTDTMYYDGAGRHAETRPTALLVAGSTTLTSADTALRNRLTTLGFDTSVTDHTAVTQAMAERHSVVVVSETVTPTTLGTKLATAKSPVVIMDSGSFSDMGMTTAANKGTTSSQTQVTVTAGTPLSAGLSGNKTVTTSAQTYSWGTPTATAVKAANIVGQPTRSTSFGYDTGVAMAAGNAPARRVGFFAHALVPSVLNTDGWALFDAAVRWAQPAKKVRYVRDANDRIIARQVGGSTEACYGFTAGGDTPDQTLTSCTAGATATETTYAIAGGMAYTKRSNGTATWSAPNIHGDVAMTFDQNHNPSTGVLTYTPDGQALAGLPENSTGDYDYGWLGQHKRGLEHSPGLHPTIEMGARPYNPDLGRFLQIDPIEGGSANDYDYCNADPINCTDLDGQAPWDAITRAVKKVVKKVKEAARATGEWAIRNRRALTAVASVVGAGVCIATAGVGCAIAAGVAFAGNALRSCYDTAVCRTGRAGRNRRWGAFATSVAIDATLAYAGGLAGAVSKSADIGRVGTYVVRAHGQAFGLAEDLSN